MKLLDKLKLYVAHLLSYLPTKLPVGLEEFHKWADSIIALSGKFADETSMKFAIASILIHADSALHALPKRYFISRLRKSAANQVASQVFQDIKNQQLAAQQAAAAATQQPTAEATPAAAPAQDKASDAAQKT
jgi:hypothetical protein